MVMTTSLSSYWRRILEARDVLQQGIRWQVGDGHYINIWNDPWLPRPYTFCPFLRQANALTMVKDLISPGPSWNRELILTSFVTDDASLILSLPLSHQQVSDHLIWHYNPY